MAGVIGSSTGLGVVAADFIASGTIYTPAATDTAILRRVTLANTGAAGLVKVYSDDNDNGAVDSGELLQQIDIAQDQTIDLDNLMLPCTQGKKLKVLIVSGTVVGKIYYSVYTPPPVNV